MVVARVDFFVDDNKSVLLLFLEPLTGSEDPLFVTTDKGLYRLLDNDRHLGTYDECSARDFSCVLQGVDWSRGTVRIRQQASGRQFLEPHGSIV